MTGVASVQSLSQTSGSINGGSVITIYGNGFSSIQNTTVKIGTKFCVIQFVTSSQIQCITSANSAGSYQVSIYSNNVGFPSQTFGYSALLTPTVTQITPISGLSGQLLIITGSGFGNSSSILIFLNFCILLKKTLFRRS